MKKYTLNDRKYRFTILTIADRFFRIIQITEADTMKNVSPILTGVLFYILMANAQYVQIGTTDMGFTYPYCC